VGGDRHQARQDRRLDREDERLNDAHAPGVPYPSVAHYTGSGSTDDAANFVAATPSSDPRIDLHWIGEWLY